MAPARKLSALLALGCCAASAAADLMRLHQITNAENLGAICGDGTPGAYYMRHSATGSSDWAISIMGGGGCRTLPECLKRVDEYPWLWTTSDRKAYPLESEGHTLLSQDPAENPLTADWNHAFVVYCRGLHFRGTAIFRAALTEISAHWHEDTRLMLHGSSAGGVAVINHMTWLRSSLPQVAELNVVLDSSWFINHGGYMANIDMTLQNLSSKACFDKWNGGPCCLQAACMLERGYFNLAGFASFTSNRPAAPVNLFVITSAFDAFEVNHQDLTKFTSVVDAVWEMGTFGGSMAHDVQRSYHALVVAATGGRASFFMPSCFSHVVMPAAVPDFAGCVALPPQREGTAGDNLKSTASVSYACEWAHAHEPEQQRIPTYPVSMVQSVTNAQAGIAVDLAMAPASWGKVKANNVTLKAALSTWFEGSAQSKIAGAVTFLRDTCNGVNCNPTCPWVVRRASEGATNSVRKQRDLQSFRWLVWTTVAVLTAAFCVSARVISRGRRFRLAIMEKQDAKVWGSMFNTTAKPPGGSTNSMCLAFSDIHYWPDPEPGSNGDVPSSKPLLDGVSGCFLPGEISAIMGPSGSGKVGSQSLDKVRSAYVRHSGYVRQFLVPCITSLTVFENLCYSALLRLPKDTTFEEQINCVSTVIRDCDLSSCADCVTGKISGGQMRRLAVAVELLNEPSILFLDEPTSGLDASASLRLMAVLQDIAQGGGRAIVLTIHQPRPEVFEMVSAELRLLEINRVMILRQGRLIYYGPRERGVEFIQSAYPANQEPQQPLGTAGRRGSIRILSRRGSSNMHLLGSAPGSPTGANNIADTIIDLVSENEPTPSVLDHRRKVSQDVRACLTELASMVVATPLIMWVGSVVVSVCFTVSPQPLHLAALLFLLNAFPPFLLNSATVSAICSGYPIYHHEKLDSCYGSTEYLLHHLVLNFGYVTFNTAIAIVIQYCVGLRVVWSLQGLVALLSLALTHSHICVAAFTVFSLLFKGKSASALILGSGTQACWYFFAGFVVPLATMPSAFRWLSSASATFYTYSSPVISLLRDADFGCEPGNAAGHSPLTCVDKTGGFVVDYLGYGTLSVTRNVLILWAMWVALTGLAVLLLRAPWAQHHVVHIADRPAPLLESISRVCAYCKNCLEYDTALVIARFQRCNSDGCHAFKLSVALLLRAPWAQHYVVHIADRPAPLRQSISRVINETAGEEDADEDGGDDQLDVCDVPLLRQPGQRHARVTVGAAEREGTAATNEVVMSDDGNDESDRGDETDGAISPRASAMRRLLNQASANF
ncbi:hypothetical protein JKP88DRAFT_332036 [Tribonema minus]|uniref:ABC transporter domain-containing protein n=1 Tax=Tribonema minus TaxID=303371 RepID=A0A835YM20_9STRA|nr:hypothetical protein JKP88DRAFT_332036 [Tribonema minus]